MNRKVLLTLIVYAAITTTAGAGNRVVRTTTTTRPAQSIPTLVYNYAYMPFICKNIANYVAAGHLTFNSGLAELVADLIPKRVLGSDSTGGNLRE